MNEGLIIGGLLEELLLGRWNLDSLFFLSFSIVTKETVEEV